MDFEIAPLLKVRDHVTALPLEFQVNQLDVNNPCIDQVSHCFFCVIFNKFWN